ncbi:hypothetical protein ASF41_04440 [Methylobacterium sp. Leaf111]|jgi:hypothetical protein|uniref:NepR family anti-sigma factor n=1 Tax=Methylobacterium sp. Leaf111 TaxID=1736257 RepID=UPI000700F601|nr:NepR family anti-sigma factor [Methylobacterium sp. Leaf111]KQP76999.1 hypothetical protein ASF41_04440 [Methylobacterium sp. Leaf111]
MSIDSSDPNRSADPGDLSLVAPMAASRGAAETTATMAVARSEAGAPEAARAGTSGVAPPPSPWARQGEAGMTVEARRRIGRNLRLLYAEVLNQPLPDRFDALLADLAARSTTRGS